MTIAAILAKKGGDILSIGPTATLTEAAALLTVRKIGSLVVMDGDRLVGILSERDIVRSCAERGGPALTEPVSQSMTTNVLTADPQDKVDNALARMTDRRIRHLPVIEGGKLVGVVSIGDLVKAQIDEALAEADAMRAYIATG
jgi:CBS domain-containing protein